jgi:hypothetical protein
MLRASTIDLHAAILAALRKRNGGAVVGEGAPARWKFKEAANGGGLFSISPGWSAYAACGAILFLRR